jgi:hypothetical protein
VTDAWQDLLLAAENDNPVVVANRAVDWPAGLLAEFQRAGLLEESTMLEALPCPGCPEAMLRDVEWIEHPLTGKSRPYRLCPSCGPEEVSIETLKRWIVVWPALAEAIGYAFGTRGASREIIPQRLWRLGKATSGSEVYFGRALHRQDAAPYLQSISQVNDGWLIVPKRIPEFPMSISVTSLVSVSAWDDGALSINGIVLPASTASAGQSPKRRRRKRADRAALIDRLTREMERHVRAARDHAQAALDFRGEAVLLPRPTQRDLAARCDATEVSVSRCLRDPTARELKMLWNLADDLDRLVRI